MLEKNEFRYRLEQRILPNTFYKDKDKFLDSVLDKGGKFFSDLFVLFAPPESAVYSEKDFGVAAKKIEYRNEDDKKTELYIVIADMPKPDEMQLCRRIYFCYEEESDTARYFTSELSFTGDYFICSVINGEGKGDYGIAPEDTELEFRKVGNTFLKQIIGKE